MLKNSYSIHAEGEGSYRGVAWEVLVNGGKSRVGVVSAFCFLLFLYKGSP